MTTGRSFRFEVEADDRGGGARAGPSALADRLLANPVMEDVSVSVAPDGAGLMAAAGRGGGVPRDQLRARRGGRPRGASGPRPTSCGTATPELGDVDAVVVPGGFAHGDYLRPGAIARFSPVMGAVGRVRPRRRPGRRDLQRLPGPHRGGTAAGRAAEEPRPALSCAPPPPSTVASDRSVLTAGVPVGTELALPHQPLRRQLRLRPGHARRAARRGPGGAALRREPERVGRRHRRDLQRGRATWSGSCPTPSGRATSCSARPTGWCCSGRCSRSRSAERRAASAAGPGDAGLLQDRGGTPAVRQVP